MICTLILTIAVAAAPHAAPADRFERVEPAAAGYSAEGLAELAGFLEQAGSSSMLILQDGRIVFEWGDIHRRHTIHSIRKALLNALLGNAIGRGQIDVGTTLAELGIEDQLGLTQIERTATVGDLLRQRSGVYHPAAAVSDGMLARMPARSAHLPGEHFYYNNWDFNVLGAIYEQATGRSIYQAFLEEIAQPLGMTDYQGRHVALAAETLERDGFPDVDGFYQYERDKSDYPAYHFRLSTHDLALFGQLYLQHGRWEDRQLVPATWIDESTTAQAVTNADYNLGYGLLWGVVMDHDANRRNDFYHTGTGVHMLGVYPERGMVFVHRVDTEGDYDFPEHQLYQVIRLVFAAREE